MNYIGYAVAGIALLYVAAKGAVVVLDEGFRWLAERNGF
jgi:hypothetical protein